MLDGLGHEARSARYESLRSALFRSWLVEKREGMVWKRDGVTEIKPEPVVVTPNETSEIATDLQVGSGHTYLVPGGGTIDAHRKTQRRYRQVSRHVPGGLTGGLGVGACSDEVGPLVA